MSLPPSSQPHRTKSFQGFMQTPPTPADSQKSHDDWPLKQGQQQLSSSHAMQWDLEEPQGLGLLSLADATGTIHHTNENPYQPFNMPYTSDLHNSRSPLSWSEVPVIQDPWINSCDPMATLLPASAAWNPFQQTSPSVMLAHDASPCQSEYSTSTRPSVESSPYAHSEGYTQRSRSPMIKLEGTGDRPPPYIHFMPDLAPLEHSLLVDPGDLVAHAGHPFEQHVGSSLMPSALFNNGPDMADVKPSMRSLRPPYRRAISSADVHTDVPGDRRKRGFTQPENANCSCDRCGKHFQRSYNLKAHLETHDPHRSHPHRCGQSGCDKRFVRRTDLLRHRQSVR